MGLTKTRLAAATPSPSVIGHIPHMKIASIRVGFARPAALEQAVKRCCKGDEETEYSFVVGSTHESKYGLH